MRAQTIDRKNVRLSSLVAPSYVRSLAQVWRQPSVTRLRFRFNPLLSTTIARLRANDGVIELNPPLLV